MFVHRNPTKEEEQRLLSYLSTFRDGTGSEREIDGTTRAGWRQIERVFAELLEGNGGENKAIFDVVASTEEDKNKFLGFSIKSKELSIKKFESLAESGRVYMEIANSPAKFWKVLIEKHRLTEVDFREQKFAGLFGNSVIEEVRRWHEEGKKTFEAANLGSTIDLKNSCYLCVSYSKNLLPNLRSYQVHAFDLGYSETLTWKFKSKNCLSGLDTKTQESVIDWYALSGGQLKYYPKASEAKYRTSVFHLLNPPTSMSIHDKAVLYFPGFVNKEMLG